jgi:PBP1b-binding outer membrane lipoprotein LpoB
MKKIYYLIAGALVAAACSSPKYTASFNSYESHAAKSAVKPTELPRVTPVNEPVVLASLSSAPVEISTPAVDAPAVKKTYVQMNNAERKALRNHLRSEIRTYVKEKKNSNVESTQATKRGMDNDLKLAAIFGAVGIVALIISGNVFYIIGGIALIIGVVFFVKWLVRQ